MHIQPHSDAKKKKTGKKTQPNKDKNKAKLLKYTYLLLHYSLDVNISWLLTQLDDVATLQRPVGKFAIDRVAKTCHTPRRNAQVRRNHLKRCLVGYTQE